MNDLINILRTEIRKIVNEELEARDAAKEAELKKAVEPVRHMRVSKYNCYPKLRKRYPSYEALGKVINMGLTGIQDRMHGKVSFTEIEKELILKDLGLEVNAANKRKIFDIGRKEKAA